MSDLRARLHRIETVDLAGLVAGALNTILREAGTEPDEADRRAAWWEAALGAPVPELAREVDRLRGRAGFRVALLAFAPAQQWRAVPLRHLHNAILDGSERRYRRWRWSARAYVREVARFVDEQARRARAAAARPRLESSAAGTDLRRYTVHAAHVAALRLRSGEEARSGMVQEHAALRIRDVLEQVALREQERAALLRERNALRKAARAAGAAEDASIAGAKTLRAQVRGYERLLREHAAGGLRAQADEAAGALATGLRSAFPPRPSPSFAGYEGEPPLLLRLAATLSRPSPVAEGPAPADATEPPAA